MIYSSLRYSEYYNTGLMWEHGAIMTQYKHQKLVFKPSAEVIDMYENKYGELPPDGYEFLASAHISQWKESYGNPIGYIAIPKLRPQDPVVIEANKCIYAPYASSNSITVQDILSLYKSKPDSPYNNFTVYKDSGLGEYQYGVEYTFTDDDWSRENFYFYPHQKGDVYPIDNDFDFDSNLLIDFLYSTNTDSISWWSANKLFSSGFGKTMFNGEMETKWLLDADFGDQLIAAKLAYEYKAYEGDTLQWCLPTFSCVVAMTAFSTWNQTYSVVGNIHSNVASSSTVISREMNDNFMEKYHPVYEYNKDDGGITATDIFSLTRQRERWHTGPCCSSIYYVDRRTGNDDIDRYTQGLFRSGSQLTSNNFVCPITLYYGDMIDISSIL